MRSCRILACAFAATIAAGAFAQTGARRFVQSFYDWYVPASDHIAKEETPTELVLRKRSHELTPELLKALKRFDAAQRKSPGEVVGPDFDLFLNSQDPAEHYFAGEAAKKGDFTFVRIYAGSAKKHDKQPAATAKIRRHNGKWQFVDILYSNGPSMLHELKQTGHSAAMVRASS